jgi:oligopeptide/dipeptide ABC transporter ATP-binding protein
VTTDDPLLKVRDLRVAFDTPDGTARAVDGVSFDVARGETVGLVGESGSGKSVTAMALLRLIESPGEIHPDSRIAFEGDDLLALDEPALRKIRGRRIALVFQEPSSALTPVLTIGAQIAEVARAHEGVSRDVAWQRAVALLARTGVGDPESRARQYPHELSGGLRQRALIAAALMLDPALLIADEPTTALDVTVQAQILDLLRELQRATGMSVLLITHDLGVVAETCTRVLVMYAGQIVESGPVATVFAAPAHPYTAGLLAAMPRLDHDDDVLTAIPGTVPPATAWPVGCRFRERCAHAWDRCAIEAPALVTIGDGREVRCHLVDEPARRVGASS